MTAIVFNFLASQTITTFPTTPLLSIGDFFRNIFYHSENNSTGLMIFVLISIAFVVGMVFLAKRECEKRNGTPPPPP